MSYPAPPPPGGAGGPNPYQAPYGSAPQGIPPKKKDNTLWWVLGIIAAVVILCCCSVGGFFLFAANEASDQVSSYSSSANSSKNADAAGASTVSEGGSITVDGAAVQSGWSIDSTGDVVNLSVSNTSGTADSFYLTFYLMEDGNVLDDVTCNTSYLEPGETDSNVTCIGAVFDVDDRDEIRVSQGL